MFYQFYNVPSAFRYFLCVNFKIICYVNYKIYKRIEWGFGAVLWC